MITKLDFTNVNSVTYNFNEDIPSVAPIHTFDVTVEQRVTTDRYKMQAHGVWPTYTYKGGMEIHIEGDLLADGSDDYVTKRQALLYALYDAPDFPIVDRKLGDLVIGFDGTSEDWTTPDGVTISMFSAPLEGKSPNFSNYLITFFSWVPYFVGVDDSSNKYYWA